MHNYHCKHVLLNLSLTLTVKIVNVPLESDFSHLVTTREAETRKKGLFYCLTMLRGDGFCRCVLGSFVRYPAIRLAVEIVDIYV